MAYCDQSSLIDYLDFGTSANAPEKAVVCAFTDGGAGMPPEVLSLFVFGAIGLAMTYRIRHPAPLMVAFILTGGVAAATAPAGAMRIVGIALFVGLAALGMYIYTKARRTL